MSSTMAAVHKMDGLQPCSPRSNRSSVSSSDAGVVSMARVEKRGHVRAPLTPRTRSRQSSASSGTGSSGSYYSYSSSDECSSDESGGDVLSSDAGAEAGPSGASASVSGAVGGSKRSSVRNSFAAASGAADVSSGLGRADDSGVNGLGEDDSALVRGSSDGLPTDMRYDEDDESGMLSDTVTGGRVSPTGGLRDGGDSVTFVPDSGAGCSEPSRLLTLLGIREGMPEVLTQSLGDVTDNDKKALEYLNALRAQHDEMRTAVAELNTANKSLAALVRHLTRKFNVVAEALPESPYIATDTTSAQDAATKGDSDEDEAFGHLPGRATQILMKGYVNKKGRRVRNWKRRFFVLRGGTLSYYTDETCATRKGKMRLDQCLVDGLRERDETGRACLALSTKGRTLFFQSDEARKTPRGSLPSRACSSSWSMPATCARLARPQTCVSSSSSPTQCATSSHSPAARSHWLPSPRSTPRSASTRCCMCSLWRMRR
ncbi:NOD3 protein [Thecamonas trahens ATCC 50062]|uniref:NOD3 protein n=1 Tax=Thecamonas trahens ATCC 50062 TaxID=461836 RepID=A0A0L0DHN5_THETB|nr:NOD3 protein [Thecamonas trahens ATCC 50062]KNC51884.1 NOD3 protein [Thecamonas trahens ATCC 50062]|eukprot:XP_013755742.1 NOD3 protein [Thecamonas trahens ATCC 50062]